MKKSFTQQIFKLMIYGLLVLAGFTQKSNAQNYLVSGSWNSSQNGTYVYSGTCNGFPYYVLGTNVLMNAGFYWGIGDYSFSGSPCGGGWIPFDYYNFSGSSTPPTSGWSGGITVEIAAPKLIFSTTQFVENSTNNGTISTSITITHNNFGGASFTGSNGDNFVSGGKVAVYNIPSGLVASIVRNNNLSLTFTLTGTVSAHANANDINNLNVVFANGAFSDNNASNTVNSNSNFGVNFIEVLTVGSGNTYATIQSAVNAANDFDVLSLAAQTFTEPGININDKSLTILGHGASTIVQANANPSTAADRVFSVSFTTYSSSNLVSFEKLNIKNGYFQITNSAQGGGAIYGLRCALNIDNCNFEGNNVYTTGGNGWFGSGGGAIMVQNSDVAIQRSTFHNNQLIGGNTSNQMGGGAIMFCEANKLDITNSTFSSNNAGSSQGGGAIYAFFNGGSATTTSISLINSTFSQNITSQNGGAYFGTGGTAGVVNFTNSIFYGNTATVSAPDIYTSSSATFSITNCLIQNNTNIGSLTGTFNNCIINQNPLLGNLADNGGYTKTFALASGSPAIDAGVTSQGVPLTDQRGASTNNAKDIGSYEYCPSTSSTTNVSICSSASPYSWNGVNYTTSGVKTYTTTNSQGCDSVATLNLTINVPTSSTDSITINASQLPYSWNGLTFNGAGTQTAYLTNVAGCDSAATLTLSVTASTVTFHLKAMLQGLYLGNGKMIAAPFGANGVSPMNIADTITVELRASASPFNVIHTIKGLLDTSGNANITFPSSVNGNSYYVAVLHRNSIPVWSASPITFSATTSYDFTNAITKAFGSNMVEDGGVFMLFSGDINQDGSIDFSDYPDLDISSYNGDLGYYVTDLNGDASVDFSDYPTLDFNSSIGKIVAYPH